MKKKLPLALYFMVQAMNKIAAHWDKLRKAEPKDGPSRFRTLKEKTGMKFGSGIARKYRRATAMRALKLARRASRA